jgi:hypothetical protein
MSKKTLIIIVVLVVCVAGYYKWKSMKADNGSEALSAIMCESTLTAEAMAKSKTFMEEATKVREGGGGREELKARIQAWRSDFMARLGQELTDRGSSMSEVEAFCSGIVGDLGHAGEKTRAFIDGIHEKCPSTYNKWSQEQIAAIGFFLGMCALKM